jgi:hypothetical protein
MMELSYRRHRFSPVVIQQAVWVYLRFPLNYTGTDTTHNQPRASHPTNPAFFVSTRTLAREPTRKAGMSA